MTTHDFNWQSDRDSWWGYLVTTALSGKDPDFEEIATATDRFTDVKVGITVNGIEVNATAFMEGLIRNYDYAVSRGVEEKIEELGFNDLADAVSDITDNIKRELFDRARSAGIELRDEY